jgi:hypothetical protein
VKKILNSWLKILPLPLRKKIFYAFQRSVRDDIARQYLQNHKIVLGGVFQGMKLVSEVSVQNYTLAHMLGIYEPNIQTLIIDRMTHYKRFVDIGCASGVFSVGVPFVTKKPSIGFDIDKNQVKYANQLAQTNDLQDQSTHHHISYNEDYNDHIKNGDFCLIDIEGGEIDLIKSLNDETIKNTAFLIEIHKIDDQDVNTVANNLIQYLEKTHTHKIFDEEANMDFRAVDDLGIISRNDFVYFSNGQRDYFQKWVLFEPK